MRARARVLGIIRACDRKERKREGGSERLQGCEREREGGREGGREAGGREGENETISKRAREIGMELLGEAGSVQQRSHLARAERIHGCRCVIVRGGERGRGRGRGRGSRERERSRREASLRTPACTACEETATERRQREEYSRRDEPANITGEAAGWGAEQQCVRAWRSACA